ncbi:uncharacterized protein LOC133197792 isoform X2 [Saccostrea echinata]|uniref:uncharacterized protein LOC133197792 isoform X2 n=1 Tax=Saccostrea echinata TaxID=191078 RepID=UPI002A83E24E|nr:uncharacterized protein LOC133197792 isoform X2 [Saccostrea echinata]
MDFLWEKLKSINANHFIFVLLCGVIAYLFRASDSYNLKPVWRKRSEPHHFTNKIYPTLDDRLPSPIITDLDGDGTNEILLITHDFKLNIMALPDPVTDEEDDTLPHVVVKQKAVLPINVSEVSRPVAMETGFTIPYSSMMQIRKQIIVVVTDDWQVLCYNHNLELLWHKRFMDVSRVRETYTVKAMGTLITAHNVKKTDQGLVIVGGSFTHLVHAPPDATTPKNVNHTEDKQKNSTEDNTLTHFSSFAVSALDGTVRWHHLPGDFGEIATNIKDIHGDHHWKLALKRHRLHVGEAPWTMYKKEFNSFTPHLWRNLEDTKLTLGRFRKSEETSQSDTPSSQRMALTPEHVIGYAYGGHRPHSNHEHVENPNSVVIHTHNGIEVLNLLSGRPVTELRLPGDGAVYLDIDGDGEIEQILWGQQDDYSPCYIEIWRINPVKERIEQLPVCRITRLFFTSSWAYDEDNLKKLPPIIIKSVARKTGLIRYLMGHHLPKFSHKYDIITFGGVGRVSSWDREGNANWQVATPANWAKASTDIKKNKERDHPAYQRFMEEFWPSRVLMSIPVYGQKNVVALSGYSEFVLVDLVSGNLLAEHSLPCHPTSPLIVGDFDNDGVNDVIVTCSLGYIGFSLHHKTNHIFTAMYGLTVFSLIILLNWLCSPQSFYGEDDEEEPSDEDEDDD